METLIGIVANNAPLMVIIGWGFWHFDRRLIRIEDRLGMKNGGWNRRGRGRVE